MKVVIEGVGSIVVGRNPALIQEQLEAMLPPRQRETEQQEAA